MKIFSIEHYEDKLEDLNRMEEIAAYHAGYAHVLAEVREEIFEKFRSLYAVMQEAEALGDQELEAYMGYSIIEMAAKYDVVKEGEVISVDEVMMRLVKRIKNANFEAIYYMRKSTEISKRIIAAAKVLAQLQKIKIFKLEAALAIGKMLFPGRFN